MFDGFASRFDQDVVHLLRDKDSKLRNLSTKVAIDLLKHFCGAKDVLSKSKALKSPS